MSFHGMIDQKVWDGLMMQTPNKGANYVNKDGQDYLNADGNLVRAKFKAPIRDAVKDAIGFLQHKEGQLNCEALDRSIAEGNRLLALEKKELESAFRSVGLELQRLVANTLLKCWGNTPRSLRKKEKKTATEAETTLCLMHRRD